MMCLAARAGHRFCSAGSIVVGDALEVNEKTIGSVIRDLMENFSTLVRSEVALAKHELKQTAAAIGAAGAFFFAALFFGLFSLAFFFVTAILALALVVPAWLATLIVAVVLLIGAVVLAILGQKKVKTIEFVPADTIESVKSDIASIRSDIARAKEK